MTITSTLQTIAWTLFTKAMFFAGLYYSLQSAQKVFVVITNTEVHDVATLQSNHSSFFRQAQGHFPAPFLKNLEVWNATGHPYIDQCHVFIHNASANTKYHTDPTVLVADTTLETTINVTGLTATSDVLFAMYNQTWGGCNCASSQMKFLCGAEQVPKAFMLSRCMATHLDIVQDPAKLPLSLSSLPDKFGWLMKIRLQNQHNHTETTEWYSNNTQEVIEMMTEPSRSSLRGLVFRITSQWCDIAV